jgi:hypothetical protein
VWRFSSALGLVLICNKVPYVWAARHVELHTGFDNKHNCTSYVKYFNSVITSTAMVRNFQVTSISDKFKEDRIRN